MSRFDSKINALLENLIFEQNQMDDINPEPILKQTQDEISKKLKDDPEKYEEESLQKYSLDQGIYDQIADYVNSISNSFSKEEIESLKEEVEETGLQKTWGAIKDVAGKVGSAAQEYLGPTLSQIGDAVADKVGEYITSFIGKEYVDDIQNNLSESMWYKIAAVFEPTGVMSWPYYRNALDLYEKNKGTEDEDIYFLNLLAAQISVIPGVRLPLGILTFPFRLLSKPFRLLGGRSTKIARESASFLRGSISKNKNVVKATGKLGNVTQKGIVGKGAQTVKGATKPIVQALKTGAKAVSSGAKKIAKGAAAGAKVATVTASGDIPQTWKDWSKSGQEIIDKMEPKKGTLGKFHDFGGLSTQRL
jgi:hypothetical protein